MNSEELVIRGSRHIAGSVAVPGFKHTLVLVVAHAVGMSTQLSLNNTPDILDTRAYIDILSPLGLDVSFDRGVLNLRGSVTSGVLSSRSADVHGSLYLLPGLLARIGRVNFSKFGGCPIGCRPHGDRPVQHVLSVLSKFGANVSDDSATLSEHGFRSCTMDLRSYAGGRNFSHGPEYSGATKAAILTASLAHGVSTLQHPYRKQEVIDFVSYLKSIGVPVSWSADALTIEGTPVVPPSAQTQYYLPADLIEVMTWLAVSVIGSADLVISVDSVERIETGLEAEIALLRKIGTRITLDRRANTIRADCPLGRTTGLGEVVIDANGIYSDSHPLFAAMGAHSHGQSRFVDKVWQHRRGHIDGMRSLGVSVRQDRDGYTLDPGQVELPTSDIFVEAGDLRTAASLLVTSLGLPSEVRVRLHGAHHLARGYEDLPGRLQKLGANVRYEAENVEYAR